VQNWFVGEAWTEPYLNTVREYWSRQADLAPRANHKGRLCLTWRFAVRKSWRWVLLPAVVFAAGAAAGVKAGIEYAKGNYVSKDRKFVEGEVVKDKKDGR
jgi:hypothetical protein